MSPFWSKEAKLLRSLWASFVHSFFEWPKLRKVFVFPFVPMVLDHQKKYFSFYFHWFSWLFKTASRDSCSRDPMTNFYTNAVFGAMFDFHGFHKGTFWAPFSRSRPPKTECSCPGLPSWSRPCFSRHHINYSAIWTYCFFKRHFFDNDWLFSYYFLISFVLCFI